MSDQDLIETAKASILAYNAKDWAAVRQAMAPGIVYDEVATHRKLLGADEVLTAWKGWADAFPDSKASFEGAIVSGNTVIPRSDLARHAHGTPRDAWRRDPGHGQDSRNACLPDHRNRERQDPADPPVLRHGDDDVAARPGRRRGVSITARR